MKHTHVNLEFNPEQLWSDVPTGAKVAGAIAAIALMGASLVASVFLAGAALFGGLVLMLYSTLSNALNKRGRTDTEQSDEKAEEPKADVVVTETR